jgi:hypothetical protein
VNRHTVYTLFLNNPVAGESGYLANYFKCGRLGIKRPPITNPLADAAWRAGRDCAAHLRHGAP